MEKYLVLFVGHYEYSMDDRGRIPIPPAYRDQFARGAVLGQGAPDPCLRLYSEESFSKEAAQYLNEPATKKSGRIARRAIFGRSFPIEPDKQGRVLVPAAMRTEAGLEGTVLVVGAGEWLEIWDPKRFETEMAAADRGLADTLESLGST